MPQPATTVELLLARIAESLDRLVAQGGQQPTTEPTPAPVKRPQGKARSKRTGEP